MKVLDLLTGILVVVGALNWGLIAVAEFDLVAAIAGLEFGETNAFTNVIYGLVGLSALFQVYSLVQRGRRHERLDHSPAI